MGDHRSSFASWAEDQLALEVTPSLSVAVGLGDEIVFAEAVGVADVASSRPATPATAYLLASITKPITATAVCVLAERGEIDLDAPVERYLDGVRLPSHVDGPSPTVRDLLRHRGGLGVHYRFFYDYRREPVPPFAEVAARYAHVCSVPGERFEYSNLGYGVLDEMVRVVTGSDPAAFTRAVVFDPLDMASGHLGPSYEGPAPVAGRYAQDGAAYPDYDVDHRGASLAWASASDLVRFGSLHTDSADVIGPDTVAEMQDAVPHGDGSWGYGLGWNVLDRDGTRVISHAGGMGGVSTLLVVAPKDGVAVAALANATGSAVPRRAVERLLAEHAPDVVYPTPDADHAPIPGRLPAASAGTWEGAVETYVGPIPLSLEVHDDGIGSASLAGSARSVCTPVDPQGRDIAFRVPVQLPTPDAMQASLITECHLDLRDGSLRGTVRVIDDEDREPVGNAMTHWCQLSRKT